VLSPQQSKAREIDYGDDVGLITLEVFRERPKGTEPPPAPAADDNYEDLAALLRSDFPAAPAENIDALQAQLRDSAISVSRGIIVSGNEFDNKVRKVAFDPIPKPVMTVTIIYYKP
jgi:hypothetical protein